jgi:hypothetical protein
MFAKYLISRKKILFAERRYEIINTEDKKFSFTEGGKK